MEITLRPVQPSDRDFLYDLYASTREEELSILPWSPEERAAFLLMQFNAQDTYYRQVYPEEAFQVVLADGVAAGRLYLAELPDALDVVDIALVPAYRNRGIGSLLFGRIMTRARDLDLPVTLRVEKTNRARHLYDRLGFTLVADEGFNLYLRWRPQA